MLKLNGFYSRLLVLGMAAALVLPATAQIKQDDTDVITLGYTSRYDFCPGQVIVKFKDSSRVKIAGKKGARRFAGASVSEVDKVLNSLGVTNIDDLMPLTGGETLRHSMPGINGKPVEARPMDRAYLLSITANVHEAVKNLSALDDVEYAEPNYIVHTLAAEVPNDPLYTQQWGLSQINAFKLWGEPVISKEGPIVAIIDTGVDIMHPDLVNNIWTNDREGAGVNNYDDDGNGYTDDVHGWDFVNNTGVIADFNGHGTHCAGIVAATGHNGLGIIGANPNARIMPLTAMQSNGTGDVGTLIKAIDYAAANGADIISMSLGTYAESMALEDALGRAYQKSIIVAAAGNDGYCLNHAHPEQGQPTPMPQFPAAYTFVLGVQASGSDGAIASFSNYDDNGPTFSEYPEEKLYNYEITAPGVGIVSTYPNGTYRSLSGTSMATPLVAGAISRLIQSKEVSNKEELFGDLINSCKDGVLDIYAAYKVDDSQRVPELQLISIKVDDSDGDGDGVIDAGETVKFYPTLRNTYGNARNIRYSIAMAEEANTVCEFVTKEADFGPTLSSYGKGVATTPIVVKIKENVADGRICRFLITATCDGIATPMQQEFELTAENGVELNGIVSTDMTLHAGTHYIVTGLFGVSKEATLTIEPGTVIKFKNKAGIYVDGTLVANGQPGKMITFTFADNTAGETRELDFSNNTLRYCIIENLTIGSEKGVIVGGNFENCIYRNITSAYPIHNYGKSFNKCNIYGLEAYTGVIAGIGSISNSNIVNTSQSSNYGMFTVPGNLMSNCNAFNNLCVGNIYALGYHSNIPNSYKPQLPNYLGTGRRDIAQTIVYDITYHANEQSFGEYDLSNMLTRPAAAAHGIVWKVVVDGYDAQDEYDMLPPIGVGRHKVEVYFNRPMDRTTTPNISMGVRPPYTQNAIGENGSWRSETYNGEQVDIYTAYFTVSGRQNIDGVNRICVADARDNEYFEIPKEDVRFNVNVQAAGSLSTGFFGESGVGCVKLQWEDMDMNFDDIMGYNLYRTTVDGDTICLNKQLIDAGVTNYTDYDVKTGNTYLYYYTVMTTALTENSPSKTIAVKPLTAEMGDANGSGNVDINDILTTVNYIGGANPVPFIFDAADMNTDEDINILDIVGIAHRVLDGPAKASAASIPETAYYWIEDGQLWIKSSVAIGGIQIQLMADRDNSTITPTQHLAGLETMGQWRNDEEYVFLAFSINGASVKDGAYPILNVTGDFSIDRIVLGDTSVNPQEIPIVLATDLSGVDDVIVNDTVAKATGVYNLMGIKIADDAEAVKHLPAGIYIVNGEKLIKR